jgi:hypothetical protein
MELSIRYVSHLIVRELALSTALAVLAEGEPVLERLGIDPRDQK